MIHASRPIFSTQFHPEAKGGPLDSSYLFEAYLDSVKKYRESQLLLFGDRPGVEAGRPSPLLGDLLGSERVGVAPTQGMENVANRAAREEREREREREKKGGIEREREMEKVKGMSGRQRVQGAVAAAAAAAA